MVGLECPNEACVCMSETATSSAADHDSPWKMALEGYFQEFLDLLFPSIHAQVDWAKGYSFLDKELQQITADANTGRRYADKLIQVHARDGSETWVLIHVEVQGEPEEAFAERMYTYQYRLRDRYGVDVVSLAVLADTRESFRPNTFRYQRWGCELIFTYPTAKLMDWEARWSELEASTNVFALVVMAQIQSKRVKDGVRRRDVKIALIRFLYERGYSREQVIQLFIMIDWMVQLPRSLEPGFVQAVYAIQEEKRMPYVNTIERLGIEKGEKLGIEKGRQEGQREAKEETARNLIKLGVLTDEQIAQATGLTVPDVRALCTEDKH